MKILVSAFACHPLKGSESGYGWRRAVGAAKEGHEVYCLTFDSHEKQVINSKLKELNLPNLIFVYIGVPNWVEKAYRYRPGVYLHYLIWQRLAFKKAKKLHKVIGFDVIHHITYGSLQMATELWKLKVPMVFGPVGGGQMALNNYKRYFGNTWKQEIFRKWTSRILMLSPNTRGAIKNSTWLLASNSETYFLAKKRNPKNIKIFPDASLPDNFFPDVLPLRRYDQKPLKLLWVGRLFPKKGIKLVIDAVRKVSIPYELTILGEGPLSQELSNWIIDYNLKDKVFFKGHVPWNDVHSFYCNSDVFIFCSLRDSLGVQLLEAMAVGLPIITLDINGGKNFVPNNAGIKVPVLNPEDTVYSIALAVEYMYLNPGDRKKFSYNAFEYAKEFKDSNISQQYEELYQKAVHRDLLLQ